MVSLLESSRLINERIIQVHKAFGAPGDWGYDDPKGEALYNLYMAQASLYEALKATENSTASATDIEAIVTHIVREVAELPDRTSPISNYDFMLVTEQELATILRLRLEEARQ